MSVQSARSQEIIKGDDTTQTHQIMGDVAFSAEASRAPVTLATGDLVNFFYPLQDPSATDLIGYPGVPVGAFPTSTFTVPTAGKIIDPTGFNPIRGTSTFQSGPGRTVRAEIERRQAAPTGDVLTGTNTILNVSSMSGIVLGQGISGPGIPLGSVITVIAGSTLTISSNATATGVAQPLFIFKKESHYLIDEVDISERGFPTSLTDTSGGVNPPAPPLNLT